MTLAGTAAEEFRFASSVDRRRHVLLRWECRGWRHPALKGSGRSMMLTVMCGLLVGMFGVYRPCCLVRSDCTAAGARCNGVWCNLRNVVVCLEKGTGARVSVVAM